MAFNPIAGKDASVKIGSTEYAFDAWSATMTSGLSKVTNFSGGGYSQWVDGIVDATVTLSGPYDQGSMPFDVGVEYTLILGYEGAVELTVPAILKSIKPDAKVEDAIRVQLEFQSNGPFLALIA